MEYHPTYGLFSKERGWVPAPRYLLRRHRVLKFLANQSRGRVLEIGCGAGALLNDLARMGYLCTALETSPAALELARELNGTFPDIRFYSKEKTDWSESFDVLVALEVLEHIQDDLAALHQWRNWLKPDGLLVLSVPAHSRRWNATDVWAGHYRRYERDRLKEIISDTGFKIIRLECYGFPLGNIIEPFRARYHASQMRKCGQANSNENEREMGNRQSGINRSLEARMFPLLTARGGRLLMQTSFWLQELFSNTNMGNGFLLMAKKAR